MNASGVLADLRIQNERAHDKWEADCRNVKASYKQKTSRMLKGDREYAYTRWYKIKSDGGLESIGDKEPDWKTLLPPEPKPIELPAVLYDRHLLIDQKDYDANSELFKEYLAFRLDSCKNYMHPLYKNPGKAIPLETNKDSVLKARVSSDKISDHNRTEKKAGRSFCAGCGEQVVGPILEHRCVNKVSAKKALAKIRAASDENFPEDCVECEECELIEEYPDCDPGCPVLGVG